VLLVLYLSLLFPSFTRAVEPDDELQLIDLEARSREADRERAQRNADLDRDLFSYRERHCVSPVLELVHMTVLDPEPLFSTMRPSWLQPGGPVDPYAGEQRASVWDP
jgi:hypothetical protein